MGEGVNIFFIHFVCVSVGGDIALCGGFVFCSFWLLYFFYRFLLYFGLVCFVCVLLL